MAKKLIENYKITKKYNEEISSSREIFTQNLREIGYRVNSGLSNFVLVDFETKENKNLINKKLLSKNIYMKDSLYANPKIVKNASDLEQFGLISIGPYNYMKPILNILNSAKK